MALVSVHASFGVGVLADQESSLCSRVWRALLCLMWFVALHNASGWIVFDRRSPSEREAPAPPSVASAVFASALINIEKQAKFSRWVFIPRHKLRANSFGNTQTAAKELNWMVIDYWHYIREEGINKNRAKQICFAFFFILSAHTLCFQ